jgi:methionyl-tRNA synthetase
VTEEEAAQADPDKIITITEENYFFRLSAFEGPLLKLYEEDPDFVQPEARRNEVLSFVKSGLKDLSITRSTLKWGIPLPNDPEHVFYVWFDALTTYMSAIGYGEDGERRKLWEKLWPADVHLVGKEILRFHAVYWPAFLMAAELPLPKRIYAHGWLIFQGGKMSKSKGNIVRARPIDKVVGIEGLRYYLLREIVFGQDGNYSSEALIERYNADLANGLGNLVSRTLSMIQRYFQGEIVMPEREGRGRLGDMAAETIPRVVEHYEKFEFSKALEAIWSLFGAVDKFIVERKPWVLAKNDDAESRALLCETLYDAAEVIRVGAALLYPVMPKSTVRIWGQLGMTTNLGELALADLAWGQLEAGTKIGGAEAVFPRLEMEPSVNRLLELEQEALMEQAKIMGKPAPDAGAGGDGDAAQAAPAAAPVAQAPATQAPTAQGPGAVAESERIGIEDFVKVELRVGQVKSAAKVEKTDKLLHLMVDIGEAEPRSIVAGIAKAYEPESLVGRKVVIVANLKPRKMRGIESNGMIVAATGEDGIPSLAGFPDDAPVGARLS